MFYYISSEVSVTRFLVLYVCFVDRCLSFCLFFFWPLYCLLFFDLRIMITALASSNSSYICINAVNKKKEQYIFSTDIALL